jgi:hypothetical protein
MEGGVAKKTQLVVNESYRFSRLKKSLWRSNDGKNNDKEIYWYIGDGDCKIAPSKRKEMSSSSTAIYDVDSISLNVLESKMNRLTNVIVEVGQPLSPYLRSVFAGREMIIEGIVHKLNHLGWLEISLTSPISFIGEGSIVTGKKSEVDVFLVHRRRSPIIDDLQNGTEVKVSFVFPIFLWGRLSGFAATVRSQIEIVKRVQYSPSSSSRREECRIARNGSISSCSKKYGIEGCSDNNDHKTNCQKVTFSEKKSRNDSVNVPFQVPIDIRSRCHLYAAWRASIHRKYKKCIAISSSSEHSSDVNDSSSIHADARYLYICICVCLCIFMYSYIYVCNVCIYLCM